MNHQWPPGVTRAMHQFFDAAPVTPTLTSVYEHRSIPSSRRSRRADVESEQRLVPVKEIYVSVDSPTSETRNRRRLATATAAVVAVIGVAAIAINSMNSDDDVDPAPAAAPTTVAPTTVAPRTETGSFAGDDGVPVTFTLPDGHWGVVEGWWVVHSIKAGREESGLAFWDVGNIYAEGCQWVLVDPPVGPTVDDLVSAFANLPDLAPTAAVDVTVDGYVGKQIEFTVPDFDDGRAADSTADKCKESQFALWQQDGNQNVGGLPVGFPWTAQATNMHNRLWILDVGGTRLVIDAYSFPNTSPLDRAALDEIVASIQIG